MRQLTLNSFNQISVTRQEGGLGNAVCLSFSCAATWCKLRANGGPCQMLSLRHQIAAVTELLAISQMQAYSIESDYGGGGMWECMASLFGCPQAWEAEEV